MTTSPPPTDRHAVLGAVAGVDVAGDEGVVLDDAVEVLHGLGEGLHRVSGRDLPALVTRLDTLATEAARMRTAVIAEAVRRGEVESTLTGWIRQHAPSLRQGGAGQTARLVTEATKGGPLWHSGDVAPAAGTPLGLVWEAVAAPAPGAPTPADSGVESSVAEAAEAVPPASITPANGLAVLSEMRILEPRLCEEAVPTVTQVLIDLVREGGPAHMRGLRPRLLAHFGRDGELDELQEKLARTAYLSSPDVESGNLTEYRMGLTPEQAAILEATIGPLATPAPNRETGERDLRPAGQRRAEAFMEVLQQSAARQLAAGGDGPTGAYAALHLTMSLTDLRRLTGCAEAAAGSRWSVLGSAGSEPDGDLLSGEVLGSRATTTLLSPEILRRLACGAHLIPQVLGSAGEHLDQGQEIRLFNRAQRRKLMRRDKHCTYPGCDRPAAWTRAHHVLHWWDDGSTDLDNAALLCERHHTIVHSRRLWADVRATPDEAGRYVVWDLTTGSYDRELERRRAERALNDPPSLTPTLLHSLLAAQMSADPEQRAWAAELLPWYEPDWGESQPA